METMGKVTMYLRSEFGGVVKVEAKEASLEVKQHAQYERGIYVAFKRARERKPRHFVQAYSPSLVILEGWGHPEPASMFGPEVDEGDVITRQSRYLSHDPRYQSDFNAELAAYLEEKGIIPLHDFRGHEPGSRGCVSQCACPSCESEYDAQH